MTIAYALLALFCYVTSIAVFVTADGDGILIGYGIVMHIHLVNCLLHVREQWRKRNALPQARTVTP
jgi:hypothetical protein